MSHARKERTRHSPNQEQYEVHSDPTTTADENPMKGTIAGFPWQLAYVVTVIILGLLAVGLTMFGVL